VTALRPSIPLLLLLPVLLVSPVPAPAAVPDPGAGGAPPRVVVLDLRDTIQPASLRYLERGLREAAEEGAELVVIELDTPGGLLVSLRSMTSAILGSEVPVAVHVAPSGARAASAGFFLVLAADVAAMAPGTSTGAAHPVAIGQQQRDPDQPDPSLDKAAKDAAALARSLAAGRGRPVAWAEKAVLESAAYAADEAHAHRLIDLIAADRGALLEALHGRTVTRFDGSTRTLDLRGAEQVPLGRTFAERLLTVIADPQIAYLLLMVGAIGLLIELTNPGAIVPGVGGALSLLLGIYGLSILPVSVVGGLLIAAGLGLLIAEVFATTYGLLAIAGIASFVVGSLMLVDAPVPELRIGPAVVIPTAAVLAGLTALLAVRAVRSRRLRPRAGVEAMIGAPGEVVAAIVPGPGGTVFVHGERWDALSAQPLPAGTPVRVDALDGLRLWVSPALAPPGPPEPREPREPRDRGGSS
jgi:membrane-bound serine protease (ClpP class)